MGSVETTYFAVEFNRQEEIEEVKFESERKSFETSFQAGSIFLSEAMDKTSSDLLYFTRFCDAFAGVRCNPAYLNDGTTRKDHAQALIAAFKTNITYAIAVKQMATCLETYSRQYENGVPIQEELSEIAANYTTQRFGEPTPEFVEDLENIQSHLRAFARNASDDTVKVACTDLPSVSAIKAFRDAVLVSNIVLPYRSMVEAAVLTASGYAVEGARHLEREYKHFALEFAGIAAEESFGDGAPSGDMIEIVLLTRMLSMLVV